MSTPSPPREPEPMLIRNGMMLRFNQFNDDEMSFRGGLLFLENVFFRTTYFQGMDRLAFFRNPENSQVTLQQHERLENYRVVYYPQGYFLNLIDHSIARDRGVVLQIDVLTLNRPNTTELHWTGLSRNGRDVWVTDVVLAGIDTSQQIWMRHVPVQYFRSGVEACERWLFGMRSGDVMVREL